MFRTHFLLAAALAAPPAFAQTGSGAPDVAPMPGLAIRARPHLEALWLGVDDYPRAALRAEQEGRVGLLLVIGTDGRVSDCTLLASSSSERLDKDSCTLLKRRGRFIPAKGWDGRPAPDRWNYSIDWKLPPFPPAPPPDYAANGCIDCVFEFTEKLYPREAEPRSGSDLWIRPDDYPRALRRKGIGVDVELTIARSGRPTACRVTDTSGTRAWDGKICSILRQRARFAPARDDKGRRIPGSWGHRYVWAN